MQKTAYLALDFNTEMAEVPQMRRFRMLSDCAKYLFAAVSRCLTCIDCVYVYVYNAEKSHEMRKKDAKTRF